MSKASSTWASTGSPVTTQLWHSLALTSAARADHFAFPLEVACASSRSSARSPSRSAIASAFPFIGGKVDSLAVADLVERKPVARNLRS